MLSNDLDRFRKAKVNKQIEELIAHADEESRMRMFEFLGRVGRTLEERGATYGPVTDHWGRTANIWTLLLESKLTEPLDARDVARLYIADKLSRDTYGEAIPDTAVDIAGYAAGMASMEPETP